MGRRTESERLAEAHGNAIDPVLKLHASPFEAMVAMTKLAGQQRFSFHSSKLQKNALQILRFFEADGMIGWMTGATQFGKFAARVRGHLRDGGEKFPGGNVGRTRRRDQNPARSQARDGLPGEASVGLNGSVSLGFAFRERGRIEHDEIKFSPGFFRQPLERVSLFGKVPALRDRKSVV